MGFRIKTRSEAELIIGTTWEKDGLQRTVTRIDGINKGGSFTSAGNVYWKRPGNAERKVPIWLPYFNDWLINAIHVTWTVAAETGRFEALVRASCDSFGSMAEHCPHREGADCNEPSIDFSCMACAPCNCPLLLDCATTNY